MTLLRRLMLVSLAALTACGEESEQEREVGERWLRWSQQGISDYSMRFIRYCECPPPAYDTLLVEVRNDLVTSVRIVGPRQRPPGIVIPDTVPVSSFWVLTVNQMFGELKRAVDEADWFDVEYDDQFHYPRQIAIDWRRYIADEEHGYRVVQLTPLR